MVTFCRASSATSLTMNRSMSRRSPAWHRFHRTSGFHPTLVFTTARRLFCRFPSSRRFTVKSSNGSISKNVKNGFRRLPGFQESSARRPQRENLDALIHSGALDGFGLNRMTMSESTKRSKASGLRSLHRRFQDEKSMMSIPSRTMPNAKKEALGFNVRSIRLGHDADVRKK